MHDLLRSYAREITATVDTEEEQHAALTRLFDHYLYAAAAAMDILYPAEHHRRPRIPWPATPVPPLANPATARDWLDRERAAMVAAAGHTAACGWPGHATRLAATVAHYLYSGCHFPKLSSSPATRSMPPAAPVTAPPRQRPSTIRTRLAVAGEGDNDGRTPAPSPQ